MSTYPKANRTAQWYSNTYSSASFVPNCVVVHSTETTGWPGYNGGSMAPNMTGKPNFAAKTIDWRAHFEDEESSRALVNLAGGVETNTACAIQWELVGTCDPKHRTSWNGQGVLLAGRDYIFMPDAPDWYLAAIADVVAYYSRKHGIKVQSGLKWNAYPASYGATADRLTFTEWRNFYGYCGHQHVPENDHGDPGNFPIQKALDKANVILTGGTVSPTPAPAPAAKTATATTLRSNFTNVAQGGQVTLTANVTPAVDGTFEFIWKKPDGSWGPVATVAAVAGRGVTTNVPWNTVRYGAIFQPKDTTKCAGSSAAGIVVEVVNVRAELDALKAAQTPPSA